MLKHYHSKLDKLAEEKALVGKRLNFQPRVKFLRDLERVVPLSQEEILDMHFSEIRSIYLHEMSINISQIYKIWKNNPDPKKLSFSKALLKLGVPSNYISLILNDVCNKGSELRISTRFKDILRMSASPHYISCLREGGGSEESRLFHLLNPNIAIAYVPDKAGHMLFRAILHAVDFNGPRVMIDNPYGERFFVRALEKELGNLIHRSYKGIPNPPLLNQHKRLQGVGSYEYGVDSTFSAYGRPRVLRPNI